MSEGFVFGGINVDAKKKTLKAQLVANNVLIDMTSDLGEYVLFLADDIYTDKVLKKISVFLRQSGFNNYRLVSALNVKIKRDELKGEIGHFYRTNQSQWKQYAEGAKAVVAVGAAIYTINRSTDIMVDHFRDIIFNKSYYFSGDLGKNVFPIDSFGEIFMPIQKSNMFAPGAGGPIDSYKTNFAKYQFEILQKTRIMNMKIPDVKLIYIKTKQMFMDLMDKLQNSRLLSWDLETSGFDAFLNRVGCITFSNNGIDGYFVPWKLLDQECKDRLNDMFASCEVQVGANLKFDIKFLWNLGIMEAQVDGDTVQLGHVLNEQRSNSLKAHAYYYTPFGGYDYELDKYKEQTGIDNYLDIPLDIMFSYATMDAIVAYLVYIAQQKQLTMIDEKLPNEKSEKTMRSYYEEIMMPAVRAFAGAEFRGIHTSQPKLAESRAIMQAEIVEIENELAGIWKVPVTFDFNSAQKLGKLFESLGFPPIEINKAGIFKTGDAVLEAYENDDLPGMKQMRKLRTIKTILRGFISESVKSEKGWERYLRNHGENDNRMHPVFSVMRTETGRCKCSNPNMQNVPAHGDYAKLVKACVVPPSKDFYFSTVDYASLQIRLAAIDTNLNEGGKDVNLYNVYTDPAMGGDMHTRTAHGVFASGVNFELEIIEVIFENKKYEFFADEWINTGRGMIKAGDLTETDELVA